MRRRGLWLTLAALLVALAVVLVALSVRPVGAAMPPVSLRGKYPCVQVMDAVPALSAAGVHAAIVLPTGALNTVWTTTALGITNPSYYRNITITGNDAVCLSNVRITGTDWSDNVRVSVLTGTGAATVQGQVPYKTVTAIAVGSVAVPGGKTYTVGWGDYLGLYRPIAADADVTQIALKATAGTAWIVTAAGALPAGAAVSAANGTVLPETTITEADGYMITYNASRW